jgi:hypothetical protein
MFRLASLSLFAMLSIAVPAMGCNNYNLRDRLENPGGAQTGLASCGSDCRIFVTASTYDGNLGGAQGADNKCNSDPARPQGTTNWKALISATPERTACTSANCSTGLVENFNWVLRPNTLYRRLDGQIIGTTNGSAIFVFPLQNAMDSNSYDVWTGLLNSWIQYNPYNCSNWKSNSGFESGRSGMSDYMTGYAIDYGDLPCSNLHSLYCVEQ